MSIDAAYLEKLLPGIYRIRDAERGGALRGLLSVLGDNAAELEESLEQLYDDHFIETAAGWAIPLLADLVGARLFSVPGDDDRSVRRQVANAIANRRRRGTAAALEEMAQDITGWQDALALEFFTRLVTTQAMRHIRRAPDAFANVRNASGMSRVGTPFEPVARSADVRGIARAGGTHNIPNVGLYVWPFRGDRLERTTAVAIDDDRWVIHPLGIDVQLRTMPDPERDPAQLAQPLQLPIAITRRAMVAEPGRFYGPGRSILIEVDGVTQTNIEVADLSNIDPGNEAVGWSCRPAAAGSIAVDPMLGRIVFAAGETPASVRVTCAIGSDTGLGGGGYARDASFLAVNGPLAVVPAPVTTLANAVLQVQNGGTIEISDSARYDESLVIASAAGAKIEIRSADRQRAHIALAADLDIDGDGLELTLNGLLVSGAPIVVGPGVARLRIVHSTLVPGHALDRAGLPTVPGAPSIVVEGPGTTVEIDHSIVGPIRFPLGATVIARDSIVDACAPDGVALAAAGATAAPGGDLSLERATVIGKCWVERLEMSNSIVLAALASGDGFAAPLVSERKQEGCVRFSSVPANAQTPHRYRSVPAAGQNPLQVAPRFRSLRYGTPRYGLLAGSCPTEVASGAEDASEMGVFSALHIRQRLANVRAALPDHLRFGLEAGIFVALD